MSGNAKSAWIRSGNELSDLQDKRREIPEK